MEKLLSSHSAPFIRLESCPSTNARLKTMAKQGAEHSTVLTALSQSEGRGRSGRSFLSPEGGLYLSILWRPKLSPEACLRLTPCAAVALAQAIYKCSGILPEIKWPNDLIIKDRKLCGILTEGCFEGEDFFIVLGAGINVNTDSFPPELEDIATSLKLETGRQFSLDALTAECVLALDEMYYDCFSYPEAWLKLYRQLCTTVGRDISLHRDNKLVSARAIGIDDDFSLLAQIGGRTQKISFGEIME